LIGTCYPESFQIGSRRRFNSKQIMRLAGLSAVARVGLIQLGIKIVSFDGICRNKEALNVSA
jgi:hypothetical protein